MQIATGRGLPVAEEGRHRPAIRTPDQRLRVYASSTLEETATERGTVRAVGAGGCAMGQARASGTSLAAAGYARLFPELPALAIEPELLRAIGRAGGLSDATNGGSSDARTIAAARPVFGQYLAHDLTADRSPLTHHDDAEHLANARSARFDLEILYGEG